VDAKDIKCPLEWWSKHQAMFPTIDFLVKQILGIVGSPIETIFLFFFASILNLKICQL
jgi:hypothetical protein